MRRRLLVAKAMVHSPPIVILDEPTAGVDVELRQKLWKYFKKLNEQGVTIILTTHYLEEAENLCDHIAIVNEGKIIANETTNSLLTKSKKKTIKITLGKNEISTKDKNFLKNVGQIIIHENKVQLLFNPNKISTKKVIETLHNSKLDIIDLSTKDVNLEDIFIDMTRKNNSK